MLRALLHRKSRDRIKRLADEGDDERSTEDMLTASVFSRICYLSEPAFIAVVSALLDSQFGAASGKLRAVRFWPNLKIEAGRIEPDLVLEFDDACLVVEVKRYDDQFLQQPAQLHQQWLFASKRYPQARIVQLAVGGFPKRFQMGRVVGSRYVTDQHQVLYACTWSRIGTVAEQLKSRCGESDARILDDLLQALNYHSVGRSQIVEITEIQPVSINSRFPLFESNLLAGDEEFPLSIIKPFGISTEHPALIRL